MHRLAELFGKRRGPRSSRSAPQDVQASTTSAEPKAESSDTQILTAVDILELDKAAGGYGRQLAKSIAFSFVVVLLFAAFAGYLQVLSSYNSFPGLRLIHLSGGTAMGAFAALAALITALQVAVRSSADQAPDGRRQFLAQTAGALIPFSLGLGVYVAGQSAFASMPKTLEPVGLLGPLIGGIALAVIAADAAAAAMRVAKDEESLRVVRERNVAELEHRRDSLAGSSRPASRAHLTLEVSATLLACGAAMVSAYWLGGVVKATGLILLAIGLLIAALFIWATTYLIGVAMMLRSWITAISNVIAAAIFCLLVGVQMLQTVVGLSNEQTLARNLGGTYATWSAFVIVTAVLAIRSLGCDGKGRRLGLRGLAVWRIQQQIGRARTVNIAPSTPTVQRRLATAAAWLSPLFPLGLLLGRVATQMGNDRAAEQDLRTGRILRLSTVLSWSWAALWVGACVALTWWAPWVA